MFRNKCLTLFVLASLLLAAACSSIPAAQPTPGANLPNPASAFCEQNGGKLEIRTAKDSGQSGMCVFPDKSECDEWAFFRGECKPGGWLSYHHPSLGYNFQYPSDARIEAAPGSVTITGPLVGNEHWPVIFFNHPQGRAEYAPAQDANLEQWLKTNNLLAGERRADAKVAGLNAVHLRQNSGPQAYHADHFFFAYRGQLYSVVFLHTGGKEDWALYNRFLESIRFDK